MFRRNSVPQHVDIKPIQAPDLDPDKNGQFIDKEAYPRVHYHTKDLDGVEVTFTATVGLDNPCRSNCVGCREHKIPADTCDRVGGLITPGGIPYH